MLASGARVHGAFDGSLDLSFEPGQLSGGDFELDVGGNASAPLVLQTLAVPLALSGGRSRLRIEGGTHVPASPSAHYLRHHWAKALRDAGLRLDLRIGRAGFHPRGGGLLEAVVQPWDECVALRYETRGPLRSVVGFSGASRIKVDVAGRARDAAVRRLWEARRLEVQWTVEELEAPSPGSHAILVAEFEHGRAAFSALGERTTRPEILGDRLARKLLRFLDCEAAVDPYLADQLVVALAIGGQGGRIVTPEVTPHLSTVIRVLEPFGYKATVSGRLGGPGVVEVEPASAHLS